MVQILGSEMAFAVLPRQLPIRAFAGCSVRACCRCSVSPLEAAGYARTGVVLRAVIVMWYLFGVLKLYRRPTQPLATRSPVPTVLPVRGRRPVACSGG